ncbi:LysE family translocator [Castellaniella sp.]|uniref:LysE family translocator n=1 Tax=Castellaniella sp. TaxID=1955812 RepID=UPI003564A708
MPLDTWLIFFLTCWGIAIVPGPNQLLVLTHGALYGSRKTLATVAGGVLGLMTMISLCALGLGALIQASMTWFTALKMIGGLYLIWLGINLWRAPPMAVDLGEATHTRAWSLFNQGFVAAVSNPKALLLFTAFIPPFLNPHHSPLLQTAIVALTYAAAEFVVEYVVAAASHHIRPWLARSGRRFNKLCGGLFMGFGVMLPWHS